MTKIKRFTFTFLQQEYLATETKLHIYLLFSSLVTRNYLLGTLLVATSEQLK